MPELTEQNYAGEFIVSEAPNTRSREKLTVNLGENLKAGAVLGRIRAAVGAADGGNTGDGTLGSITVGGKVKTGVYTLTCIAKRKRGHSTFQKSRMSPFPLRDRGWQRLTVTMRITLQRPPNRATTVASQGHETI